MENDTISVLSSILIFHQYRENVVPMFAGTDVGG